MFRVMMCLNCCSAARASKPPVRKLSGGQAKINNGNIVDASNFKSLKVFGTDVSRDEPDTTTTVTRRSLGDIQSVLNGLEKGLNDEMASSSTLVQVAPQGEGEQLAISKLTANELGTHRDSKSQANPAYKGIQEAAGPNNRADSPSTTRIGDYARIEYSPVAHSQSSSSVSASGRQSPPQTTTSGDAPITRQQQEERSKAAGGLMARPGRLERRHGFESSSISIASQLSSEMEKNLTNMLESANSPLPIFGTIGLPLGPMVGGTTSASSRTEAALTSGSQESLSDRPKSQATSVGFGDSGALSGGGAALTAAESAEESEQQLTRQQQQQQNLETSGASRMQDVSRVSSSMNSTISTSLTNPTPTPSELSGTSSTKKRKLSARGLLKKLRPGKSKKRTSSPATLTTGSNEDKANKLQ